MQQYFAGNLQIFTTSLDFLGSPFQQSVWLELQKIPHGQTRSYAQLATAVGNPAACKAVAQANGALSLFHAIELLIAMGNLVVIKAKSTTRHGYLITNEIKGLYETTLLW